MATALQQALLEQQKAMEATGQSALSPHEYLVMSVSGKSGGDSTQVSPARNSGSAVTATSPSKSLIVSSARMLAPPSPDKTGNVNAIQEGSVVEADAHPATGYPAADAAYMNNLPQELYAPKVFLAKHVTETLQLCLKVLEKNQQARGGKLTPADNDLIAQIARFSNRPGAIESGPTEAQPDVSAIVATADIADANITSQGIKEEVSTALVEQGLRDATY